MSDTIKDFRIGILQAIIIALVALSVRELLDREPAATHPHETAATSLMEAISRGDDDRVIESFTATLRSERSEKEWKEILQKTRSRLGSVQSHSMLASEVPETESSISMVFFELETAQGSGTATISICDSAESVWPGVNGLWINSRSAGAILEAIVACS